MAFSKVPLHTLQYRYWKLLPPLQNPIGSYIEKITWQPSIHV
jgi:hypothetical protein